MMFVSLGIGTAVAVALIAVVSVLTGAPVTSNSGQPTSALVGKSVKSFSLIGLNGGVERAPWRAGHASVLIFFASDCAPCRSEMPKVAKYVRTHNQGSVVVMGIDAGDQRSAAQAFVHQDGVTFPVGFDPSLKVTNGIFQFQAIPETVFVSKTGVVTRVYFGAIPVKSLTSGISSLKLAA